MESDGNTTSDSESEVSDGPGGEATARLTLLFPQDAKNDVKKHIEELGFKDNLVSFHICRKGCSAVVTLAPATIEADALDTLNGSLVSGMHELSVQTYAKKKPSEVPFNDSGYCAVYVGPDLPPYTNEQHISEHFQKYATDIIGVDLVRDEQTAQHRGFGFVLFSSVASAQAASSDLDQSALLGVHIRVLHDDSEIESLLPISFGPALTDSSSEAEACAEIWEDSLPSESGTPSPSHFDIPSVEGIRSTTPEALGHHESGTPSPSHSDIPSVEAIRLTTPEALSHHESGTPSPSHSDIPSVEGIRLTTAIPTDSPANDLSVRPVASLQAQNTQPLGLSCTPITVQVIVNNPSVPYQNPVSPQHQVFLNHPYYSMCQPHSGRPHRGHGRKQFPLKASGHQVHAAHPSSTMFLGESKKPNQHASPSGHRQHNPPGSARPATKKNQSQDMRTQGPQQQTPSGQVHRAAHNPSGPARPSVLKNQSQGTRTQGPQHQTPSGQAHKDGHNPSGPARQSVPTKTQGTKTQGNSKHQTPSVHKAGHNPSGASKLAPGQTNEQNKGRPHSKNPNSHRHLGDSQSYVYTESIVERRVITKHYSRIQQTSLGGPQGHAQSQASKPSGPTNAKHFSSQAGPQGHGRSPASAATSGKNSAAFSQPHRGGPQGKTQPNPPMAAKKNPHQDSGSSARRHHETTGQKGKASAKVPNRKPAESSRKKK